MAAEYRVTELHNGLRISVRKEMEIRERLLPAGIIAIIVGFAAERVFGIWSWIPAFLLGTLIFNFIKFKAAYLTATNVEFVTAGYLGKRVRTPRIVCIADVESLEFECPTFGLQGLYAVTKRGSYCILPFLDYKQTAEVIREMERIFPRLAQMWDEKSAKNRRGVLSGVLGSLL